MITDPLYVLLLVIACMVAGGLLQAPPAAENYSEKLSIISLIGVIAAGAYLRFSEISFGLPYTFHPDEIRKAQVVARMLSEWDFNPHYFLHPTLLLYLTAFIDLLFFGGGYEGAFISGRIVSAVAGVGTIIFTYKTGCYLISRSTGIIAASLMAVFPLAVTCSRYFKEDSLFTFLGLAAFYYLLKAYYTKHKLYRKLAAFLIGVAISSKYTAGIFIPIYVLLIGFSSIHYLPFIVLGFICFTPFSVLNFSEFLNGVRYEGDHILRGHTESISAWSQYWMYHCSRSLVPGVTAFTAYFGIISIGAGFKDKRMWMFIGAFLCFYGLAEFSYSKPPPQPERYILPCLPFLSVLISACVVRFSKQVQFALIAILVFLPLHRSYSLMQDISPDTRIIAKNWIEESVPKGSRILLDFFPYSPPLSEKEYVILNNPGEPIVPFLNSEKLKSLEVEYIVLSSLSYDRFFSQPSDNVSVRSLYRRIFSRYPSITWSSRYGTYGFHNPNIKIFKLREE